VQERVLDPEDFRQTLELVLELSVDGKTAPSELPSSATGIRPVP